MTAELTGAVAAGGGGDEDGHRTAARQRLVPLTDHAGVAGIPGGRRILRADRAHRPRLRRPADPAGAGLPADAPIHAWAAPEPRRTPGEPSPGGGTMTAETPAYGLWLLVLVNS